MGKLNMELQTISAVSCSFNWDREHISVIQRDLTEGWKWKKVIEDNIYSHIVLASKTTHVNSRVNGVHRPMEGIDPSIGM